MLPHRHMQRCYAVPTINVAISKRLKSTRDPAGLFFKSYAPVRNSRRDGCPDPALLDDYRRSRSDWYTLYQINPVTNHTKTLAIQLSSVISSGPPLSLSASPAKEFCRLARPYIALLQVQPARTPRVQRLVH
jgi:hypothetical protein